MLRVTGYVDKWSGSSGDTLTFFVSSATPFYHAQLTRLIHGDPNPAGPGVKEEIVACALNAQRFDGVEQAIHAGSCMIVPDLSDPGRLALSGSVLPTRAGSVPQALLGIQLRDGSTIAIVHDAEGVRLVGPDGTTASAPTLQIGQWHRFLLTIDFEQGVAACHIRAGYFLPVSADRAIEIAFPVSEERRAGQLCLGAASCLELGRQHVLEHPFNGRIADPRLFLDSAAITAVADWRSGDDAAVPVAAWRFADLAGTERVSDGYAGRFDGITVNRPTRLVAGPDFAGQVQRATDAPDLFNAIHFHDDDLGDAGWTPSFEFTVPEGMRSGVYAFRLSAGDSVDYIPFFVTPRAGAERAPLAVLIPTLSYQVYANMYAEVDEFPDSEFPLRDRSLPETPEEAYVRVNRLRSTYDLHSDGSGVCIASMHRPMPIFVRPHSLGRLNNSQHQLSADLYLIDWLEATGIPYELVTDHELHTGGTAMLARFRAVVSGTHAEYWTAAMLDALKGYTDGGGRFVCLAGNGFYWATALSDDGAIAEVRRDHGLRAWTSLPGEAQLSLDGSMGGVWRNLGRAPNKYVGVGFTAMGFDNGRPYTRTEASWSSRAAFLFEGIEEREIGDFPSLISGYGAAGVEFDRADITQGTPAHALILATASGFSDLYQLTVDDVVATSRYYGGTSHPDVRADMVFYETPAGGAVFSAASISWCGGLSYNGYDNSVSRLTANVLRHFSAEHLPGFEGAAPDRQIR